MGRQRRHITGSGLLLFALALALVVAACGTRGYAPTLGQPAHVALGPTGAATLTPVHALRVVAYYHGKMLPATGAATPAELRQGSCIGPLVAPLTDGTPTTDAGASATTTPDPRGGQDVAVDPGPNWYVVVYDRANDPQARPVACGHPLSDRQQYFDLYTAAEGSNGIAIGTALVSPLAATRVDVSLASGAPSASDWAVRTDGCAGAMLTHGTIPAGGTTATGVVFASLSGTPWWVTITQGRGAPVCARVQA